MNDNELYQQRCQAQLAEWHADIAKLRARVAMVQADAQIAMNKEISALERRLENYQAKLAELGAARADAWESVQKGVESAWDAMKSAVGDAASRFKD
jgi:chromosome segregation ATPase